MRKIERRIEKLKEENKEKERFTEKRETRWGGLE